MRTLVRLFLALVSLAALSVLYVLLCSHGCLGMRCQPAGEPGSPSYAAPRALCFQGYSRVPDGKPLVRAPCRRCALVSSSGQMLGSRLGKAIDGEECVLRMNHAPTRGYEEDVGVRSTIRVVSHTSVPLLLRNQPYFFKQSQETVYIVWGPTKKMSREKAGPTYRALLKVMEKYPSLQIYTLTEQKMAYCDDVFQNETGKNRMKSGSFLSTGWFTMILAMELCEQILVFGMVNDNYCSFVLRPAGRRTTPACLTTTSKRAGWTSAKPTWRTSERPAPGTASSPRKPSSPAGPRRGTSSSPTRPGRAGRGPRPRRWRRWTGVASGGAHRHRFLPALVLLRPVSALPGPWFKAFFPPPERGVLVAASAGLGATEAPSVAPHCRRLRASPLASGQAGSRPRRSRRLSAFDARMNV
ncbi:alpha-N-acetyl-neuraminyl-2,3-beta-galactosyl-1,3-N-acetyl-galactosaminide alpha-2,6-sialyltransferase isoform X1 [Apteryx rowi]|uniref:alpha-N-acetyl-neuraminyl-2,3-beta-galactosyl-1, 3-N-acetyl-galactosaminide alpha-2,6-sialyltransferase isoform X1 n=1 Tax=Apteryx rowi TaxID=308060 RepID=UPI000E1C4888|nr:alpha-N-acetyl-neuraminyl-2,3-beta-galactosyl-1,3-N-acetyl-galactosaminide alpha-2,6-sialyltransferase isoform X1 [Apteryx rowi]